jgi:hypothetical protein
MPIGRPSRTSGSSLFGSGVRATKPNFADSSAVVAPNV